MIDERLLKPYNPKTTEEKIYERWEKSGFFSPETCTREGVCRTDADYFSLVLPPPNVTGILHMGHSAMVAIEDTLVRFHRMRGKRTLWIPGTDHAAIATQSKVEGIIQKEEKKNRHNLGREEFLKRVALYASESHDTIVRQVKRLGASVDWSREAFTLDEQRSRAVREAFRRLHEDGLIYRGNRIVNWDPKGQTTVSDEEVEYVEEETTFYYFQYGPFVIGTARPETKFGDKYVVVHPDDKRYGAYRHGQTFTAEWINGPIEATVIKDESIDREFGTGAMTITPWHSAVDFALAQKHGLSYEQIIDERGKLLPIAGEFAGMKIKEARAKIAEKLRGKGLLVREEQYAHRVATAERSGGIIEPQIMRQWFVAVNKPFTMRHARIEGIPAGSAITLKELLRKVVESGQVAIIPDYFSKTYFHWINNLGDWCISRQIWYGHRVPVWYRKKPPTDDGQPAPQNAAQSQETYVGIEPPAGEGWEQDPDTLDTWFSSGLWTFSTLGWPDDTADLRAYHPTTLLETGYDILFFWVARMILMSGYLLGDIPFRTVYLHGLVRDQRGRKMSKSLGNIVDPLEMIEKYGADATRLSLIIGSAPGTDINLSEDRIRGYKHFANKVWNATRFVLENTEGITLDAPAALVPRDREILAELEKTIREITRHIEAYRLSLAGEQLYHYFWHTFADIIIEESKERLRAGNGDDKDSARSMLLCALSILLRALHPFMPFVTEELWEIFRNQRGGAEGKRFLMIESWPNLS